MRRYLSYGAGVNSEALRLLLIDQGIEFEAVYVDHGCDWPETQEFVKTIPNITILKPDVEGYSNLYEYFLHYKMVPSMMLRFCTDKFKINPLYRYFERPCVCYIGMALDEAHRCKESRDANIHNKFPLVENKMSRKDCKQYIRDHGRRVPMKSGCWLCPMQKASQWRLLKRLHPDLYAKAKLMEEINIENRIKKGKLPLTLSASGKRLDVITMEGQIEIEGFLG